jgi:hypothetical protein
MIGAEAYDRLVAELAPEGSVGDQATWLPHPVLRRPRRTR